MFFVLSFQNRSSLLYPRKGNVKFPFHENCGVLIKIILYFYGLLESTVIQAINFSVRFWDSNFRHTVVTQKFITQFIQYLFLRKKSISRYLVGAPVTIKDSSEEMGKRFLGDMCKCDLWRYSSDYYSKFNKPANKFLVATSDKNLIMWFSSGFSNSFKQRGLYLQKPPEFIQMIPIAVLKFHRKVEVVFIRSIAVCVNKSKPISRMFSFKIIKSVFLNVFSKWVRSYSFVFQSQANSVGINPIQIGKVFYSHFFFDMQSCNFPILFLCKFMWVAVFSHGNIMEQKGVGVNEQSHWY